MSKVQLDSEDSDNNLESEEIEGSLIKDSVLKLTSNAYDEISASDFVGAKLRNVNISSQDEIQREYKGVTVSRKSITDISPESSVDGYESDSASVVKSEDSAVEDYTDASVSNEDEDHDSDKDIKNVEDIIRNNNENEGDGFQGLLKRTKVDSSKDVEKGNAIRQQLGVWESLLECRIKLQKTLLSANKLPRPQDLPAVKSSFTQQDFSKISKTCNKIGELLDIFLTVQKDMLVLFPDFSGSSKKHNEAELSEVEDDADIEEENLDDESIASDSSQEDEGKGNQEVEGEGNQEEDDEKEEEQPPKKMRKLDDISELLKGRRDEFIDARNEAIQKWNDKTRVSSGRLKSSDFSAFDQSTVKQIEQILSDKDRLIKRTQLKRSTYRTIGDSQQNEESKDNKKQTNEYDPEIFDDDDFYHRLLREFIEQKAASATNPHEMGRQWIELQKIRGKMKKDVDVKATKGRRLRYTVHNKLVNFMAPVPYNSTWTTEGESELYSSLFGEIKTGR